MFEEENIEVEIIKLSGVPKKNNQNERKIWKSFVKFIRDKWKLGNEFLSARVMREKADAIAALSQATKSLMEAKEIALKIEENDDEIKLNDIDDKQKMINQLINEIGEDLKYLEITKGTKIEIQIEEQKRTKKVHIKGLGRKRQ